MEEMTPNSNDEAVTSKEEESMVPKETEIKEAEVFMTPPAEPIKVSPEPMDPKAKKIKTLISLAILLGGLFVGSLFVDVAQLLSGQGFSPRKLNNTDVFTQNGKTWVAFSQPIINVKVLTDDSCENENCKPDQILIFLRRIMPTMVANKIATDSAEGKALIDQFGIKTIPAFVFSEEVKQADIYAQAPQLFTEKDNRLALDTVQMGAPVGKYLTLPTVADDDVVIGSRDAKVKVIEFSDFQCPYCKAFQASIKQMLSDYGDKVEYVYKFFPLDIHPQAQNAALAGACANEQGKFLDYANNLFDKQDEWGKTTGTQKFKDYARQLGLNATQFNQCLDSKKYADKVAAN